MDRVLRRRAKRGAADLVKTKCKSPLFGISPKINRFYHAEFRMASIDRILR